jgi:hypothetical protein
MAKIIKADSIFAPYEQHYGMDNDIEQANGLSNQLFG